VGISEDQNAQYRVLNHPVPRMLTEIQFKFPIHIRERRVDGSRENTVEALVDCMPPFVRQKPLQQARSRYRSPQRATKSELFLRFVRSVTIKISSLSDNRKLQIHMDDLHVNQALASASTSYADSRLPIGHYRVSGAAPSR